MKIKMSEQIKWMSFSSGFHEMIFRKCSTPDTTVRMQTLLTFWRVSYHMVGYDFLEFSTCIVKIHQLANWNFFYCGYFYPRNQICLTVFGTFGLLKKNWLVIEVTRESYLKTVPIFLQNSGSFPGLKAASIWRLELNENVMSGKCKKWCFDFCCQFKAIQSEYQTNIKHKERRYWKYNAIFDCFDLLECMISIFIKFYKISRQGALQHLAFLD